MKKFDWKWLRWQVGLPLGAPILLSMIFVYFWWTLDPNFTPASSVVIDLTPWALATYVLTLIGTTIRAFGNRWTEQPKLGVALACVAFADTVYYAFMVIQRHNASFAPSPSVYYTMVILVFAAIILCYRAR
jgi:hypothetical protein